MRAAYDVYDDREFECLDDLPQNRCAALASSFKSMATLASIEEEMYVRRQILALAKLQRSMFPLERALSPTQPLLLAKAHIDLAETYQAAKCYAQVRSHTAKSRYHYQAYPAPLRRRL
jgi:hypothetical protein